MAEEITFFYIIQNEDFKDDKNKYYKYGITSNIESRINSYHTYSPNKFEYIKVYKLNVAKSIYKKVDCIFTNLSKDINKLQILDNKLNFSNISVFEKLNNHLLDKNGGLEFVYEEGLEYIYEIINNEFDKFGIEVMEIIEDSDEELSTIDLIDENKIHYIDRTNYKLIISKNLRNFVCNIETFSNNNPINDNHVANLKKSFEKQKNKSLDNMFVVVKFIDNHIILIDGHHRVTAYKELYKENRLKKDFEFEIHLYELGIEYEPTHKDVLDIFYKVNNTKPYKTIYEITETSIRLFNTLKKTYPKLFTKGKKRANFPHINEKLFKEKFMKKLYELDRIDETLIIDNINKKNLEYKKQAKSILKKINPHNYEHDLNKINSFNIYLGIYRQNIDWLDEVFKDSIF